VTNSIFSTFERACERWPDRPFLFTPSEALEGEEPYQLTYAEVSPR
jgi:hypothetical protein